jgi:hypothetical protein
MSKKTTKLRTGPEEADDTPKERPEAPRVTQMEWRVRVPRGLGEMTRKVAKAQGLSVAAFVRQSTFRALKRIASQ